MLRINGSATIALIVLFLRSALTKIAHVEVCIYQIENRKLNLDWLPIMFL